MQTSHETHKLAEYDVSTAVKFLLIGVGVGAILAILFSMPTNGSAAAASSSHREP